MNTFIPAMLFSFFLALPVGAGSIKILQNGLNRSPIHAYYTGTGMNVVDCLMMLLYYFGLSYIFSITPVKVAIYLIGIFVLGNLALGCFRHTHIKLQDNVKTIHSHFWHSILDGIKVSFVPSSIVYWTSLYGVYLSQHMDNFFIACLGILFGFQLNNWFYTIVSYLIKKFASQTIIKWVNIIGGLILSGFALYFVYQLFLILL